MDEQERLSAASEWLSDDLMGWLCGVEFFAVTIAMLFAARWFGGLTGLWALAWLGAIAVVWAATAGFAAWRAAVLTRPPAGR